MAKRWGIQVMLAALLVLVLTSSQTSPAQAQAACGKWTAYNSSTRGQSDARIQVDVSGSSSGACEGAFTFTNKSGINVQFEFLLNFDLGQYALDLQASPGSNSRFQWSFGGIDLAPGPAMLIPGVERSGRATPVDITKKATVFVKGDMTGTRVAETGVVLKIFDIALAMDPSGASSCALTKKKLAQLIEGTVLKGAPVTGLKLVDTAGQIAKALHGKSWSTAIGKTTDLLQLFFEQAAEVAKDGAMDCASSQVFAKIAKNRLGLLKIVPELLIYDAKYTWDYGKYQGWPTGVTLEYTPAAQIAPVPPPPVPQPPPTPCVRGPELFSPPNGYTTYAKNTIFRWRGYTLNNGEYFELYVKAEGDIWRNPGGVIKQHPGEFYLEYNDLNSWNRGRYYWEVRAKRSDGTFVTCEPNPPPSFTLIEKDTTPVPAPVPYSSSSSSWWSSWSTWSY